ncbi:MAG: sigma 54-interacting transcriptional regulator [bacterium]|nr:sigma 54-interacting transcriptional regulator [bacterium]
MNPNKEIKETNDITDVIGETRGIKLARRLITQASKTETPVLLQGETGTGKDLICKIIHSNSSRAKKALVTLNCASLDTEVLKRELFHEEEGFQNVFERARGGTLFLKEIDALPLDIQIKLLNRIKKDQFRNTPQATNFIQQARIITSTEKELERLIGKKAFREDLYYQLNVIHIYLPPLRKRIKDFPLLTDYFCQKFGPQHKKTVAGISSELFPILRAYEWLGNIQEFANAMEYAVNMVGDGKEITAKELPEHILEAKGYDIANEILFPQKGIDLKSAVKKFERNLILQALDKADGTISNAAEILHVKRTTLVEKIKREKINSERFKKRRRLHKTLKKRKIS